MQLHDPCPIAIMLFLNEELKKKKSVSFNEVMAAPGCKKFPVKDIGKALELLRRNGLVKASSRFGCSELLEFNATGITEAGLKFLKEH